MEDFSLKLKDIELKIKKRDNYITEKMYVSKKGKNVQILSNINHHNSLLFFSGKTVKTGKNNNLKLKRDAKTTFISYEKEGNLIRKKISIKDQKTYHFLYNIDIHEKCKYSKIHAFYEILLGNDPDYTWVPHVCLKENHVIPDHVFRSPAILYQKKEIAFALIPDLDIMGKKYDFPMFMDFKLKNNSFHKKSTISFGFGKYKPDGHIRFKHKSRYKIKFSRGTKLIFGYYVRIYTNMEKSEILKDINFFLWRKYGAPNLRGNLEPQVIPYKKNVKEGFKAIFDRHQFWGNFTINGIPCGGSWQKSWMGEKKKDISYLSEKEMDPNEHQKSNMNKLVGRDSLLSKIIMYFSNSPFWINVFDKFTRHFGVVGRTAEIWNNAWFLNLRTGYAFLYFGRQWDDKALIEKGKRTLNTVLELPRVQGVFPSVVAPPEPDADHVNTINGLKAFHYTNDFHLVDTSLTMYWALLFSRDYQIKEEEVREKSMSLYKLIKKIQLDNGAIPTYIAFEEENQNPRIRDLLLDSASSGAALMFLMELYKKEQNDAIISIGKKIAEYIEREIIPQDKWHDYEPFFSCTNLPLDVYDVHTKSHIMNLLCVYWCAEGIKELFKISGNKHYLELGERVLAILSLFQQVWDMPNLSFHTLGGFGSQNADAEVSDARQGLFVRTYMEYYLLTGKEEYMERGIATLRACWAMQLLPEYKDICPGNVKGIKTLDGIDKGCICENYGHSGHDLRVPGYIMFDWGVGTSASANAYIKQRFGDLFVDFKEKKVFGIDGINIRSYQFEDNTVKIEGNFLSNLKELIFKGRGVIFDTVKILINQNMNFSFPKKLLEKGKKVNL